MNQFVSRHNYGELIEAVGGEVIHQQIIIINGKGYDKQLKKLNSISSTKSEKIKREFKETPFARSCQIANKFASAATLACEVLQKLSALGHVRLQTSLHLPRLSLAKFYRNFLRSIMSDCKQVCICRDTRLRSFTKKYLHYPYS